MGGGPAERTWAIKGEGGMGHLLAQQLLSAGERVLDVQPKRHRDLGRTRTQVVCLLHAVLYELVPGGVPRAIIAAHAARLLDSITPAGAVEAARCELAAAFIDDLRRAGAQLRETKDKLTAAVRASGTSLTGLFGRERGPGTLVPPWLGVCGQAGMRDYP